MTSAGASGKVTVTGLFVLCSRRHRAQGIGFNERKVNDLRGCRHNPLVKRGG